MSKLIRTNFKRDVGVVYNIGTKNIYLPKINYRKL